ncbi:MAG: hypothetical protein J7K23_02930 [Thermoproteales archaeon]|nr:hypothetical protein [Thermoproteales archaeon]
MSVTSSGLTFTNRQVYEDIIRYTSRLLFYLNQDIVVVLERLNEILPREVWIDLLIKMDEWLASIV